MLRVYLPTHPLDPAASDWIELRVADLRAGNDDGGTHEFILGLLELAVWVGTPQQGHVFPMSALDDAIHAATTGQPPVFLRLSGEILVSLEELRRAAIPDERS